MKRRGCSHEIISDTLNEFDMEIDDYYKCFGRSGIRTYTAWLITFVRVEILRIGKLQFQIKKLTDKIKVFKKDDDVKILIDGADMHQKGMVFGSAQQADEEGRYFADIKEHGDAVSGYAANEFGECVPEMLTLKGYKEILSKDDYVISVHIPSDGSLDYELCEKSYKNAEELFVRYYPEYKFKAFVCFSWLMEKRLKTILGKETNITRFADEYFAYPVVSDGNDIYLFLYNLPSPVPACELPEKSSLQKKVKNYLESGNVFYSKGGIRLFKYK